MNLLLRKYNFRLKNEGNKQMILDIVRKKYVSLTPEEWVRQHLVWYLLHDKEYPLGRMSCERKINLGKKAFRFDFMVRSKLGVPLLAVEVKAPDEPLSQKVFDQLIKYNLTLKAPFLAWTNGLTSHILDTKTGLWLEDYPEVTSLN